LDVHGRLRAREGQDRAEDRRRVFHCLRHTGASRMLAAGVDVKTVMEIGGWKNLAVMQRYLHPTDERKREAVNAIGKGRGR
jgi:integrase